MFSKVLHIPLKNLPSCETNLASHDVRVCISINRIVILNINLQINLDCFQYAYQKQIESKRKEINLFLTDVYVCDVIESIPNNSNKRIIWAVTLYLSTS